MPRTLSIAKQIDTARVTDPALPRHIAMIMDGNRRWGEQRGIARLKSHEHGYEAFKKTVTAVFQRGIEYLTVFAFSTENWNRPPAEVAFLMQLFDRALAEQSVQLHDEGISIRFIGDRNGLPPHLQDRMTALEKDTAHFMGKTLVMAMNYGGRAEIVAAVRKICSEHADPNDITEEYFASHLFTAGIPDPDLVIRTSGECRTSGFLPWQTVYSELYFTEKFWPDFDEEELERALAAYASRVRRFGK